MWVQTVYKKETEMIDYTIDFFVISNALFLLLFFMKAGRERETSGFQRESVMESIWNTSSLPTYFVFLFLQTIFWFLPTWQPMVVLHAIAWLVCGLSVANAKTGS